MNQIPFVKLFRLPPLPDAPPLPVPMPEPPTRPFRALFIGGGERVAQLKDDVPDAEVTVIEADLMAYRDLQRGLAGMTDVRLYHAHLDNARLTTPRPAGRAQTLDGLMARWTRDDIDLLVLNAPPTVLLDLSRVQRRRFRRIEGRYDNEAWVFMKTVGGALDDFALTVERVAETRGIAYVAVRKDA